MIYKMHNSKEVAGRIKQIDERAVMEDWYKLCAYSNNPSIINPLSRCGLKIVDYFTFHERLRTVGNKGISFMEFLYTFSRYADKPYVQRQLDYYRETRDSASPEWKKYNIFKMYFGSINAFKPTVAMKVYHQYSPHTVLDFTAGWGGRMIGACAYGVPYYVGIDTNVNLLIPYGEMVGLFGELTNTHVDMHIWDAATFDYSRYKYDMVFTSPPYYGLERYTHQPVYKTRKEMSANFYQPAISNAYHYLSPGVCL